MIQVVVSTYALYGTEKFWIPGTVPYDIELSMLEKNHRISLSRIRTVTY